MQLKSLGFATALFANAKPIRILKSGALLTSPTSEPTWNGKEPDGANEKGNATRKRHKASGDNMAAMWTICKWGSSDQMRIWLFIAAANGFIAVAAGAFAAHGLQGRLDAHALTIFETGARYQMYHALATGLAAIVPRNPATRLACMLFLAGIILFSGSLYLLAATGTRIWGFVTPFGGVAFLAGWAALAWSAMRAQ